MCTLSWFQESEDFHLFFNRDELLDRRPEIPPRYWNHRQILAPVDGDTGQGTWLGMSAQGLLLCLLNYYPKNDGTKANDRSYRSRGELIPRLLCEPDVLKASIKNRRSPFGGFSLEDYRPFTLACFALSAGTPEICMFRWGQGLEILAESPPVLSSSSYRSEEVEACRRNLFYRGEPDFSSLNFHWNFHRSHRSPEGDAHSVCMHRAESNPGKTVSFCYVAASRKERRFELKYFAGSPCELEALEFCRRDFLAFC